MSGSAPSPRDIERLAFAHAHLGEAAPVPERASSDAGFRSYWRTRAADGSPRILMDSPPEREDVRPWLAMHARLAAGGVRVPAVLAQAGCKSGCRGGTAQAWQVRFEPMPAQAGLTGWRTPCSLPRRRAGRRPRWR